MSSTRAVLAGFVCAACAQPALARDVICPAFIAVRPAHDGKVWTRVEQGPAPRQQKRYGGFTIYEGAPADLIALAPDQDDGAVASWKLDRTARYTIVCRYAGTKWTLHSPAFDRVGACTARKAGKSPAPTISCD